MCDCLVAAEDRSIFAKNSDRHDPDECQPLLQFPAAHHSPESRLRCTHIEIPQVAETYRVMGHSPWWVWGFEHGVNEHRVALGNLTVFSKEPPEAEPGLIGMDLVRLGLERGRSARESLEVIAALLEKHGQGGAAFGPEKSGYHNAFVLADPGEAWLLETSGRRWTARRTQLASHSNHIAIGDDWEIGSRDLESFARDQNWWSSRQRLDFAVAYRNRGVPASISEGRAIRGERVLERGARDVTHLQRSLRDHLETDAHARSDEQPHSLCSHELPVGGTTASLVAPLPRDDSPVWPVWVSFATPCTGVFLPMYIAGVIPACLARGDRTASENSAWWKFRKLQTTAEQDLLVHRSTLREGWQGFEAQVEAERGKVEAAAAQACDAGDQDRAAQLLSQFMARTTTAALAQADALRGQLGSND